VLDAMSVVVVAAMAGVVEQVAARGSGRGWRTAWLSQGIGRFR
jgi:hypothetical protein